MVQNIKAIFAFWLYYPDNNNGLELVEKYIGKHLDLFYEILMNNIPKTALKLTGIKNYLEGQIKNE